MCFLSVGKESSASLSSFPRRANAGAYRESWAVSVIQARWDRKEKDPFCVTCMSGHLDLKFDKSLLFFPVFNL